MSPLVIPIVALILPLVLVPTVLGIKYARYEREMEHAERMKALELGRTLSRDEPWTSPAKISLGIGAGVPIGVFLCAYGASQSVGYREEIWITSAMVGMCSVICGSLLAAKHFTQRAQAEALAAGLSPKPAVDPDAFDVVGSRG